MRSRRGAPRLLLDDGGIFSEPTRSSSILPTPILPEDRVSTPSGSRVHTRDLSCSLFSAADAGNTRRFPSPVVLWLRGHVRRVRRLALRVRFPLRRCVGRS